MRIAHQAQSFVLKLYDLMIDGIVAAAMKLTRQNEKKKHYKQMIQMRNNIPS